MRKYGIVIWGWAFIVNAIWTMAHAHDVASVPLSASSDWWGEKLQQAGAVGIVIMGLFAIGLGTALWRLVLLICISWRIRQQLRQLPIPNEANPLGRILSTARRYNTASVETLELRLLEVIVDEQHRLERGLSLVKLFASLSPMLGLLGTVLGMIETFQLLSVTGAGDPSITAGGISTALITTVLGLVSAMPLLLCHALLTSRVERLRVILEKHSLGLVAQQAEAQSVVMDHSVFDCKVA